MPFTDFMTCVKKAAGLYLPRTHNCATGGRDATKNKVYLLTSRVENRMLREILKAECPVRTELKVGQWEANGDLMFRSIELIKTGKTEKCKTHKMNEITKNFR